MKPNLVARRSLWKYGIQILLLLLLSWTVIPLICIIGLVLHVRSEKIEFYDNKIVRKTGLLNKKEHQTALTKIMSVTMNQSLFGRIFSYGNIFIDVVGKGDVQFDKLKNPKQVKKYLESIVDKTNYDFMNQIIHD